MPARWICGLAIAIAIVGAVAGVLAGPSAAQSDTLPSAAKRCFEHHKFGAQPVDVAKTADRQTVLAQVAWGYHDAIGCYLTLDDTALAALQAAPPPQSLPDAETDTSKQCFQHHQFGQRPVDVAKSADRQTVLARLSWGHHETIGCYLTLDDEALATLRAANASSRLPDTSTALAVAVKPWDVSYGNQDVDVCAIRDGGTVNCWLWVWHLNHTGEFDGWVPQAQKIAAPGEPAGQFTTLSAAKHSEEFCGIRADQTIACWFNDYFWWSRDSLQHSGITELDAPTGQFKAISVTSEDNTFGDAVGYKGVACGVQISGKVSCWTWDTDWGPDGNLLVKLIERDVPAGQFTDISLSNAIDDGLQASAVVGCGIEVGGAVACWTWGSHYDDEEGALIYDVLFELEAPDGSFAAFNRPETAPAENAICALGANGSVECWAWECDYGTGNLVCSQTSQDSESSEVGERAAPSGQFSTVLHINNGWHGTTLGACGLRVDGAIQCWSYQLGDDGTGRGVGQVDEILQVFDLDDPTG